MRIKFQWSVVAAVFILTFLATGGAAALLPPPKAQPGSSADYDFYAGFSVWAQVQYLHSLQKEDIKHAFYYSELNRQALDEMKGIISRYDWPLAEKDKRTRELLLKSDVQIKNSITLRDCLSQSICAIYSGGPGDLTVQPKLGKLTEAGFYSMVLTQVWAKLADSMDKHQLPEAMFFHETIDLALFRLMGIFTRNTRRSGPGELQAELQLLQKTNDKFGLWLNHEFYLEMKRLAVIYNFKKINDQAGTE